MVQHFCHPKNHNIKVILILIFFDSFCPLNTLQISTTMRIHPLSNKRNMNMGDGFDSSMNGHALKKLRKLPHVFSKVLELPFGSDADVSVEDGHENIRFFAKIDVQGNAVIDEIRVRAVEIHPGVTKIVVKKDEGDLDLSLDQLNVDTWRFRLPLSAQPDLASAVFANEELIITVPKGNSRDFGDGMDVWRGDSQLVLVQ